MSIAQLDAAPGAPCTAPVAPELVGIPGVRLEPPARCVLAIRSGIPDADAPGAPRRLNHRPLTKGSDRPVHHLSQGRQVVSTRRNLALAGAGRPHRGLNVSVQQANRFVAVGRGFEVEQAGSVSRIWCGRCDKHDQLLGDNEATVEQAKAVQRCGERSAPWDRKDIGVRP